jgi:hypothetical protein
MVSRGTPKDLGERWGRNFHFIIPVRRPGKWRDATTTKALTEALSFLSGDHFDFTFRHLKSKRVAQHTFPIDCMGDADVVSLFSGGMDSFAGVVQEVAAFNAKPILVSHWPLSRTKSRQSRLIESLKTRMPQWRFPAVQALVHLHGADSPEPTQRTRSFLYLSLAAVVAKQLNIQKIRAYENGVVALNLPIWRQSVGAMDTRTVHPKFLVQYADFLKRLLSWTGQIENPFFFKTRAEVAQVIHRCGLAELIEATTSCSRVYWMSESTPHCGVCSQCIDRRFSLRVAGLENYDPDRLYENDVLRESMSAIEARGNWTTAKAKAMAVGYVRSAAEVRKLNIDQFLNEFPEVWDAIPYLKVPEETAIKDIYELQQRQAEGVLSVMSKSIAEHSGELASGAHPQDSLIGLIASQEHRKTPVAGLAQAIAEKLEASLPEVFQSRTPQEEKDVQDAAQAILHSADAKLDREYPQLQYAVVTGFKADFTSKDQRLFVEIKFPRPPSRTVKKIVDEITQKILQYQTNGGSALFVVYDYHRMIADRQGFCAQFAPYDGIFVRVLV